ncbi:MAG TPA: hypothetical protein VNO22_05375 [Planctomycetota bacterium]|jgi:hypothetical protein|nr:hypothetical protein [Planctomycetota bacterium]
MKRAAVAALILALAACATPPAPARRVDIVVRNTTDRPLDIHARAGLFGRSLRLAPGQSWRGWALRDALIREISIEIVESAPSSPGESR